MSGNRGVGIRVAADESDGGGVEVGAIPEVPAAIAETIYVGRASFHMEVEHETGETAAPVLVVPAQAPEVDAAAWFRETPTPEHERTAIIDFSSRLRAAGGPEGVPDGYGGPGSAPFGSRKLISSRWSLGLPLIFGAFFCGLLLSPLASSSFSFSRSRDSKAPKAQPAASAVTTSSPPAATPVPPAPAPSGPVAPVIAPITPIAPVGPAGAPRSNLVAGLFTGRSMGAGLTPVWGRAMKKNGLRKATPPRRPAHGATVVAAAAEGESGFASSKETARTHRAAKQTWQTWVDPWAEN